MDNYFIAAYIKLTLADTVSMYLRCADYKRLR